MVLEHRYLHGCVCAGVHTYICECVSGTYHSQCTCMSNRSREHYHSYYIYQYKHSSEMALRNDYGFCWWIIMLTRREYIIRTVNSKPEKWKGSPSALQTVATKINNTIYREIMAAIKFGELARNRLDKYLVNFKLGDSHDQIEVLT